MRMMQSCYYFCNQISDRNLEREPEILSPETLSSESPSKEQSREKFVIFANPESFGAFLKSCNFLLPIILIINQRTKNKKKFLHKKFLTTKSLDDNFFAVDKKFHYDKTLLTTKSSDDNFLKTKLEREDLKRRKVN